ncbi:transitional endoplasmic reticulum ATPase homolog 1-like [Harpegnathos saltator]|uniref:transitional endoplasmic reticulum ATPase homolog 1-like n=1 Tax=Harpegnathos saltator TaxID=610380 RepID=UPI000DBED077|nr:transitional endoplasmic reticulum ATPase homolog 1-like [Harpegnathos saltator]
MESAMPKTLYNHPVSPVSWFTVDGRKPRTKADANMILYCPPDTGKTAAARAVAQTLRLNLAFVNAENLLSSYRSETEKNLRILYERMRVLVHVTGRNVILLIDEVDGLVKNRSGSSGAPPISSGDYSLLTRFLTILEPNDGTDNYGVTDNFSVFTTNRLDNLDDAFRRRCIAVFFRYVTSRASLAPLAGRFLADSMDNVNDISHSSAAMGVQILKREFYLRISSSDGEQDGGGDGGGGIDQTRSGTNREIVLDMPPLSIADIVNLASRYKPITRSHKYNEYLGDDDSTRH